MKRELLWTAPVLTVAPQVVTLAAQLTFYPHSVPATRLMIPLMANNLNHIQIFVLAVPFGPISGEDTASLRLVLRFTIQDCGCILFDLAQISSHFRIIQLVMRGTALDISEIACLIVDILVLGSIIVVISLLFAKVNKSRRLNPLTHLTAVRLLVCESRALIISCCYEASG